MVVKIEIIEDKKLERIKGGEAITIWTGIVITAITIFVSGIIEGITNPERCKS